MSVGFRPVRGLSRSIKWRHAVAELKRFGGDEGRHWREYIKLWVEREHGRVMMLWNEG